MHVSAPSIPTPTLPPVPAPPPAPPPPPTLSASLQAVQDQQKSAADAAGKGYGADVMSGPQPLIDLSKGAQAAGASSPKPQLLGAGI